jgi:3-oxoacyl-(acyl-carrier-protein) synthase III
VATGPLAIGAYVPSIVIDNESIAAWSGASPEWIKSRTGIDTRRYAPADMPTSALAHAAVEDLVRRHPTGLDGVTSIIVATSTPDRPQPPTAATLQRLLGLDGVAAFDLNAVCCGFLFGLKVAAGLLRDADATERVLLVGADEYSTIMDRRDKRTVSLFGDGAGAVVLGAVPESYGLRAIELATDGKLESLVHVPGGGSLLPLDADRLAAGGQFFRMDGHPVRDYVLDGLPRSIHAACQAAGVALGDVRTCVFHQANVRVLEEVAKRLDIAPSRVVLTAHEYGNTAAASIPITLVRAQDEGSLTPGDDILLAGVGGGMSRGAALLKWSGLLPGPADLAASPGGVE